MHELIKMSAAVIGGEEVNTVNARELWKFLDSRQRFADWIKNRISKYNFEEDKDFFVILGKSSGGRPDHDYAITLDMAKELAMVENNEQGRKARRYFIEIEKEFRRGIVGTAQLMTIIRQQERELFAAQLELSELRPLLPNCKPGDISSHTGQPKHFLRRMAATSRKTSHSFDKLQAALSAADQVLPGFTEALADGRIHSVTIPAIAYES